MKTSSYYTSSFLMIILPSLAFGQISFDDKNYKEIKKEYIAMKKESAGYLDAAFTLSADVFIGYELQQNTLTAADDYRTIDKISITASYVMGRTWHVGLAFGFVNGQSFDMLADVKFIPSIAPISALFRAQAGIITNVDLNSAAVFNSGIGIQIKAHDRLNVETSVMHQFLWPQEGNIQDFLPARMDLIVLNIGFSFYMNT